MSVTVTFDAWFNQVIYVKKKNIYIYIYIYIYLYIYIYNIKNKEYVKKDGWQRQMSQR